MCKNRAMAAFALVTFLPRGFSLRSHPVSCILYWRQCPQCSDTDLWSSELKQMHSGGESEKPGTTEVMSLCFCQDCHGQAIKPWEITASHEECSVTLCSNDLERPHSLTYPFTFICLTRSLSSAFVDCLQSGCQTVEPGKRSFITQCKSAKFRAKRAEWSSP